MGGSHVTLLPEEVRKNCDYIMVGEGEITWPKFLEDFYEDKAKPEYICEELPSLKNMPIVRRDLIKKRYFTKGAVIS